jgi:uncharacterized membrane protein YphA (DoxX/SURF4 family)
MKLFNNSYFLFSARCILAFIFIFSGIEKIADPAGFSEAILNYKLLPEMWINLAGITIPWIELTAGVLLLFGISVKENAFIISTLLLIFILAIGISIARDLNIDCGCFGTSGGTKVGFTKIGENIILLGLGVLLLFYNSTLLSLESRSNTK